MMLINADDWHFPSFRRQLLPSQIDSLALPLNDATHSYIPTLACHSYGLSALSSPSEVLDGYFDTLLSYAPPPCLHE
eukprot:CAMPEP_0196242484 /NCGR_PEP_ID=MMETSP0913-20130531/25004_1 /TAXON_ID=49265 /ORGANISM="Thalassiosira rotula, Strain GSO102" /LENGTH=76 /DNA_ID=CAMNT_0041525629 /DNA_START=27 /DNA_END=254 /DNA_ORIENTATION=-